MLEVIRTGASRDAYSLATLAAATGSWLPITTRSGCMKSWMAEPSRKNSGLETTSARCFVLRLLRTRETMSPVRGGTVDLLTTTSGPSMQSAIEVAADSTYDRSASPPSPSGVLTAMIAYSAPGTASSYWVVNASL